MAKHAFNAAVVRLQTFLDKSGIRLPTPIAQAAVAAVHGARNWNTLVASGSSARALDAVGEPMALSSQRGTMASLRRHVDSGGYVLYLSRSSQPLLTLDGRPMVTENDLLLGDPEGSPCWYDALSYSGAGIRADMLLWLLPFRRNGAGLDSGGQATRDLLHALFDVYEVCGFASPSLDTVAGMMGDRYLLKQLLSTATTGKGGDLGAIQGFKATIERFAGDDKTFRTVAGELGDVLERLVTSRYRPLFVQDGGSKKKEFAFPMGGQKLKWVQVLGSAGDEAVSEAVLSMIAGSYALLLEASTVGQNMRAMLVADFALPAGLTARLERCLGPRFVPIHVADG